MLPSTSGISARRSAPYVPVRPALNPLATPTRSAARPSVDAFVSARPAPPVVLAPAAPPRSPDLWKSDALALAAVSEDRSWSSLSSVQRGLFGAAGEAAYRKLSDKQRQLVLLLSERLFANGIDLQGMRLLEAGQPTRPNRILFAPDSPGMERFKAQLEGAKKAGRFDEDKVFALFHPGMAEDGYREDRSKFSMQIGLGDKGAFVDVDRFHPWTGLKGWLGHFGEIITPGKPSVDTITQAIAG